MKTVVTITGIRPDFIRMSEIFKKLDESPVINHILIHTGQHYDKLLSDVFFEELQIREPNFTLNTGKESSNHYEQLSYLSTAIINLFKKESIEPDLIVFLGDSNSVCVSLPLKKCGYKVCHIEAGMRSGDKRMLEEVNRTVCDHCSDILFVYHDDYANNLYIENIRDNVYVVGNTIVEVASKFIPTEEKVPQRIILDIHRPENFNYPDRMRNIIKYANMCGEKYGLPVKMLAFNRTLRALAHMELGSIEVVPLMSFKEYLNAVYHSKFIISDSGTAQEEPAILGTKVIVPRDFTERPQSVSNGCSYMLNVNNDTEWDDSFNWLENEQSIDISWLGNGDTAHRVVSHIEAFLES